MAESLLSYALLALETAKGELGLGIGNADHDDAITLLINALTTMFERQMNGRRLASTQYSSLGAENSEAIDPFDGDATDTLFLPQYPVTAIDALQIDGETQTARPDVDSSGYIVDGKGGWVRLVGGVFSWGAQNVDITYTAGFAAIPDDVRFVVILELKRAWAKAYKGKNLGKSSESDALGNRTWIITTLLPETLAVLGKYRRVNIA